MAEALDKGRRVWKRSALGGYRSYYLKIEKDSVRLYKDGKDKPIEEYNLQDLHSVVRIEESGKPNNKLVLKKKRGHHVKLKTENPEQCKELIEELRDEKAAIGNPSPLDGTFSRSRSMAVSSISTDFDMRPPSGESTCSNDQSVQDSLLLTDQDSSCSVVNSGDAGTPPPPTATARSTSSKKAVDERTSSLDADDDNTNKPSPAVTAPGCNVKSPSDESEYSNDKSARNSAESTDKDLSHRNSQKVADPNTSSLDADDRNKSSRSTIDQTTSFVDVDDGNTKELSPAVTSTGLECDMKPHSDEPACSNYKSARDSRDSMDKVSSLDEEQRRKSLQNTVDRTTASPEADDDNTSSHNTVDGTTSSPETDDDNTSSRNTVDETTSSPEADDDNTSSDNTVDGTTISPDTDKVHTKDLSPACYLKDRPSSSSCESSIQHVQVEKRKNGRSEAFNDKKKDSGLGSTREPSTISIQDHHKEPIPAARESQNVRDLRALLQRGVTIQKK